MTEKEVLLVYRYLKSMVADLPEWLRIELRTINIEISEHLSEFRQGEAEEPDWDRYAREINFLLEMEGYDPIYTMVAPLLTAEG